MVSGILAGEIVDAEVIPPGGPDVVKYVKFLVEVRVPAGAIPVIMGCAAEVKLLLP